MRTQHSSATRLVTQGSLFATSVAALGILAAPSHAQSLTQGFDTVSALSTMDWSFQNLSSPAPTTAGQTWRQGNGTAPTPLPAPPSGTAASYALANFTDTGGTDATGDTISDWMITPTLTYVNGSTVTFYTCTASGAPFPDRLQVLFSSNGTSTNVGTTATSVGDFTKTLLTINPNLLTGTANYPDAWTQYTATLSGLSGPTSGRVAFRYFVTDGGTNGPNSDIIGVDSLVIAAPTPEPSQYAAIGLGVLGIGALALKARRRIVLA